MTTARELIAALAVVNPWWLIGAGVALLPAAFAVPLARAWRARGGFPGADTQRVPRPAAPRRGPAGWLGGAGHGGLATGGERVVGGAERSVGSASGDTPVYAGEARPAARPAALPRAAARGVRGNFSDLTLATLLGALEQERRTGVLSITGPHAAGVVVWRRGRLVQAWYEVRGAERDEAALRALLRLPSGTFHFVPQDVPGDAELGRDVTAVLMAAAQEADDT